MSFKLVFLPEVVNDLAESITWYKEQSIGLGEKLETEFYSVVAEIQSNLSLFQIRYQNIRIAWLQRFPFGLHYYIQENTIVVTGLIHASRNPNIWEERLK